MEIVRPPVHGDLEDLYFQLSGPYFGRTLKITQDIIAFDGYFRYESALFREDRPVHRFYEFQGHTYLLAFVRKRTGKNTSSYFYDEEMGGKICLSPTEIIEMTYRVVEKDPPKERWDDIRIMIREEAKRLKEVNYDLHCERMKRELEERKQKFRRVEETGKTPTESINANRSRSSSPS
jgi:hypothetical protein